MCYKPGRRLHVGADKKVDGCQRNTNGEHYCSLESPRSLQHQQETTAGAMVHLCCSGTNSYDELNLTRCVCVCIYISFSTSQVNHEMFPKLPHEAFVYLYTQSPLLCCLIASLKKKKKNPKQQHKPPPQQQENLRARALLMSEVHAGSDSHRRSS